MSEENTAINPGFLIKHSLALTGLNAENVRAIRGEIDTLSAVEQLSIDEGKQKLKISYDASHHNIDDIVAIVRECGADIRSSWWNRTKLGWQRQTDQNIRDNSTHEAHCCGKVPPGYKSLKK